ncbi:HNH endonuclease [Clostridium estertheticum]|nr:HNH endonuclease [Clostridium estertheticum]WLC77507.1 HNH endonuclease [Clostridium estertheticum]
MLSHSKPWDNKHSNDFEKLDIFNVFLFCPNHDKAYDKGYISFNDDGTIIISSKLDEFNKKLYNINEDMKIELEEDHMQYVTYHRGNIFQK